MPEVNEPAIPKSPVDFAKKCLKECLCDHALLRKKYKPTEAIGQLGPVARALSELRREALYLVEVTDGYENDAPDIVPAGKSDKTPVDTAEEAGGEQEAGPETEAPREQPPIP